MDFERELIARLGAIGIETHRRREPLMSKYNHGFCATRKHTHNINVACVHENCQTIMRIVVQGYLTFSESRPTQCTYNYMGNYSDRGVWNDMIRGFGSMDNVIKFITNHIISREDRD